MSTILWLILGLLLALPFVAYGRSRGRIVFAQGLVVAALVYVLFALRAPDPPLWLAIEIAGVGLYGALAWLGLRGSRYWLVAGWALHPLWDVGLHLSAGGRHFAPLWYTLPCLSFDLLVAVALLAPSARERRP
ncbi:MAG: hypothetical protein AAF604_19095 [Acidobacteriota bacterium]